MNGRTRLAALALSLAGLLAALGACSSSEPPARTASTALDSPGADTGLVEPFEPVDLYASTSTQGVAPSSAPQPSAPCSTGRPGAWTLEKPTTVAGRISSAEYLTPTDIIVTQDGTATVAYQGAGHLARTADDPPAADDPMDPSGGRDETWLEPGDDHLAVDGSGTQTMVVQEPVRFNSNTFTQFHDLVVADRPAGGSWSTAPVTAQDKEITGRVDVAVNASGAAVLVWSQNTRYRAIYRTAAGAPWSGPQRIPAARAYDFDVDIDDAGRIVLAYDRPYENPPGVYAIRRSRDGRWTPSKQLSGPDTELFGMALNADGVAVVSHGPTDDGTPLGRVHTSRMTADGTWQAPVRQPHSLGLHGVSVDERGRALIGGWDRGSLRGRWSRADGTWRQPFNIAADVDDTRRWGLDPHVTANGRGDALAAWGTKTGAGDLGLWARFAAAGGDWTKPQRVTPTTHQPTRFDAAIGDCGHAAFAWTSGKPHQLHIRRATPSGNTGRPGQVTGR
ncbi:hypothetical protein HN031_09215 [Nocardioides sp. zg-1308]|uniref:hypothetical protein n=1 Tax=Nocardioides sp. zg-1308 TaxID=2736253 RepID=UPI0015575228|nr:hypothetical protein [Nocardioides sp. zg-1308]NPD04859.1 hypothetical protein [Nocardioides sp. zg-1308]